MYFCRSWFSNMISFRYVSVVLNFLHDIFFIKFYTISSLRSFQGIFYNFLLMRNITRWMLDNDVKVHRLWSKSISWKYFIFHEMTLKLYFMKCPERNSSQCILPFRDFSAVYNTIVWIYTIVFTKTYRILCGE